MKKLTGAIGLAIAVSTTTANATPENQLICRANATAYFFGITKAFSFQTYHSFDCDWKVADENVQFTCSRVDDKNAVHVLQMTKDGNYENSGPATITYNELVNGKPNKNVSWSGTYYCTFMNELRVPSE